MACVNIKPYSRNKWLSQTSIEEGATPCLADASYVWIMDVTADQLSSGIYSSPVYVFGLDPGTFKTVNYYLCAGQAGSLSLSGTDTPLEFTPAGPLFPDAAPLRIVDHDDLFLGLDSDDVVLGSDSSMGWIVSYVSD